jgi:hypothetical protein
MDRSEPGENGSVFVVSMKEFYHPKPERFAEICQRIFPYFGYDYRLARRTVTIPALLNYSGYPLATNQFCFRHQGHGRSLWSFLNEEGDWFFKCCDPHCGIKGDVVGMWYLMVWFSGFAPPCWNMDQACGDLMTRAKRGMIDLSVTELEDGHLSAKYPLGGNVYRKQLEEMIANRLNQLVQTESVELPKLVRMSIREAIKGLFPDDGLLLITPQLNWQKFNIRTRNEWLADYQEVLKCSYVSSNYLSRDDVNCSYAGMEGIHRRWIVIEDDKLTLEQQMWIHTELGKKHRLCCVCFSGGKSLHGWYHVQGYSEAECFELYAEAIGLGISDCNTWTMSQPVRLPNGWNYKTQRKQTILLWRKLTAC